MHQVFLLLTKSWISLRRFFNKRRQIAYLAIETSPSKICIWSSRQTWVLSDKLVKIRRGIDTDENIQLRILKPSSLSVKTTPVFSLSDKYIMIYSMVETHYQILMTEWKSCLVTENIARLSRRNIDGRERRRRKRRGWGGGEEKERGKNGLKSVAFKWHLFETDFIEEKISINKSNERDGTPFPNDHKYLIWILETYVTVG